jgi:hypothetical protein
MIRIFQQDRCTWNESCDAREDERKGKTAANRPHRMTGCTGELQGKVLQVAVFSHQIWNRSIRKGRPQQTRNTFDQGCGEMGTKGEEPMGANKPLRLVGIRECQQDTEM